MRSNQLKAGAMLSYVSILLNTIVGLAYTPFMLRMMGQSEYGLYCLVATIVQYLTILDCGFGNAIIRYTAEYKALHENGEEKEHNLNGMFFVIYTILGMIVGIGGFILYLNIESLFSDKMTSAEIEKAKILMTLLIFNLSISFPLGIFSSILTAHEQFIFLRVANIVRMLLYPCIMIPLLFLGYRSIGMVVVTTCLNISILLINMWYCFKKLKVKLYFNKFDVSLLREIVVFSFYMFLENIVDKINWSSGQFILGAVSGTTAVAIYSVAIQISSYYISFSTAISGVFLPKITTMVTKKATDKELSDLFIKVGRIQYMIMQYLLCCFLLIGKDIIDYWAGVDYGTAYYIVAIIIIPVTVPIIQNIGISILQAQNKQKFRSMIYVLISVLTIGISVILSKTYGGIGCAIGTAIALILGNGIIMNLYYCKKIHIDILGFWKEIYSMTVPISIAFVSSVLIHYFIESSGYAYLVMKVVIFTMLVIPLMWFMGINQYEKSLVGGLFTASYSKFRRGLLKIPRVKSVAARPLAIHDFSGYNQPFHPSVLYLKEGFNGYKYWMVQTPFPIGGLPYRDRWECPCVYYSNDGIRWETNQKINPIDDLNDDEIANGDYFSDPHLVYRKDTNRLECWYRITYMDRNNQAKILQYPTYIVRKTSKDGLHWSERVLLIDLQNRSSLDNMVRSPAIIWDMDKKVYRMWYVDTLPTLNNRKIMYAESKDGMTWTEKININMDQYIDPWHIDVNYFDETYHLINYTLNGRAGINHYESKDGINFRFTKEILRPSILSINSFYRDQLYRSCSVKVDDEIRVYFSASDGLQTYIGVLIGDTFEKLRLYNPKEVAT